MSTHDHDNDALPGEDELKSLYRSLPRKEPSPALDRAIKRAAADAVRSANRRPVPRWPFAVASAAMVLVAAGLGWRMMLQPSSVPQIPTASSVPASTAPAPAPVSAAPMPPPPPAPEAAIVAKPAASAPPKAARRSAPQVQPAHDDIRTAMKAKVAAAPEPPPAVEEAPAPAMPAPQESVVAAAAPMPIAAPPPAPPAPPASPALMQAAPASAAAASYANTADSASNAPMGGLPARQSSRAAAMKAVAAPAPMAQAPMPALDVTAANPSDTPVQELAKIRQLFAWHRHDEAMQRLAAFQKAHPDIPLPDDLQAQLPAHE